MTAWNTRTVAPEGLTTTTVIDTTATGDKGGVALSRTTNMPSRPTADGNRTLSVKGTASGRRVDINLSQRAGAREATGTLRIDGVEGITRLGVLQITDEWASITAATAGKTVAVTVDLRDPSNAGRPTMVVNVESEQTLMINTLPRNAVTIRR